VREPAGTLPARILAALMVSRASWIARQSCAPAASRGAAVSAGFAWNRPEAEVRSARFSAQERTVERPTDANPA
jgi:hypothetical protein